MSVEENMANAVDDGALGVGERQNKPSMIKHKAAWQGLESAQSKRAKNHPWRRRRRCRSDDNKQARTEYMLRVRTCAERDWARIY